MVEKGAAPAAPKPPRLRLASGYAFGIELNAYVLMSASFACAEARFALVTTVRCCVLGSTLPVFMNVAQAKAPNAAWPVVLDRARRDSTADVDVLDHLHVLAGAREKRFERVVRLARVVRRVEH